MSEPGPSQPSVEELRRFLHDDPIVAQTLDAATAAARVPRAADELLIVEPEDLARLARLDLNDLSSLRRVCERLAPTVVRLLAEWRKDSDSPLTPQELLWALTYVVAAEGDDPADRIRALVAEERWWQRATESHRTRFLDGIVTQIANAQTGAPAS